MQDHSGEEAVALWANEAWKGNTEEVAPKDPILPTRPLLNSPPSNAKLER